MSSQLKNTSQDNGVTLFIKVLSKVLVSFVIYFFVFQPIIGFFNPLDEDLSAIYELSEEEDSEESRALDEEFPDELMADATIESQSFIAMFYDKRAFYHNCHLKSGFECDIPYPPPQISLIYL